MPSQGESTDLPPITINKGGATSHTQSGSMHLRRNTAAGPPRSPPKSSLSSPHSAINNQKPSIPTFSLPLARQHAAAATSSGWWLDRRGEREGTTVDCVVAKLGGQQLRCMALVLLRFCKVLSESGELSISPVAVMIPTGKGSSGCEPPTPSSTQKGKKLETKKWNARGCSPGPAAGTSGDDGERWCTLATTLLHASSLAL
nr:hypothetical protein Iba_chr09aCG10940 [Ipomoea batatas]GME10040.1 hypothetical protein Iba_scaffold9380CG0080 [Ipomoea batatas]